MKGLSNTRMHLALDLSFAQFASTSQANRIIEDYARIGARPSSRPGSMPPSSSTTTGSGASSAFRKRTPSHTSATTSDKDRGPEHLQACRFGAPSEMTDRRSSCNDSSERLRAAKPPTSMLSRAFRATEAPLQVRRPGLRARAHRQGRRRAGHREHGDRPQRHLAVHRPRERGPRGDREGLPAR